jgi:hypothetical protein
LLLLVIKFSSESSLIGISINGIITPCGEGIYSGQAVFTEGIVIFLDIKGMQQGFVPYKALKILKLIMKIILEMKQMK